MSDREAFENWFLDTQGYEPFNKSLKQELEERGMTAWEAWQAALQHSGKAVALERVEAELISDSEGASIIIVPDPEGSLVWYDNAVRAMQATPQPVVDVNQKLVSDKYEKLEPALEALVDLCNNLNIGTYDEVIAAEAALERLYLARKALLSAGKETV
jgi:hypothetical protein